MVSPISKIDYKDLYKEFIAIINEELYNAYKESNFQIKATKGSIQLYLSEQLVHVISMSKDGDSFIMCDPMDSNTTYNFTSKIIFREYFFKVIDNKLDEYMKENTIDLLIKSLSDNDNSKYDLSKITTKWFRYAFNSIAYDFGNYEDCDDVFIEYRDDGILIGFGLDCHKLGYFKKNYVRVSNKGSVMVKLCDHLVGSDIDLTLKNEIEIYIKRK